jgi:hypothetical protein
MPQTLPFHDLWQRHTGVTQAIGDCYSEAARVCLDRHHNPPATFSVEGLARNCDAVAEWQAADQRTRGAWANEIDATELGAYGLALAAIELADGMVAVRRAETGTGADYYVAPIGATVDDLENCFRLEVSGVDRGDSAALRQRLGQKVRQAMAGQSNLPAVASVVGFLAMAIITARAEAP